MSLAFGAILFILLLLPGIIFRFAYVRSHVLRRAVDLNLLTEAVLILVLTLLLHTLGTWVLILIDGAPDLILLLKMMVGGLGPDDYDDLGEAFWPFLGYSFVLALLGMSLGYVFQVIFLRLGWDERFKILRIFNDWDKYFMGYALTRAERRQLLWIQVDMEVNGGGSGQTIYSGVLEKYSLNRGQHIEQIFISNVIQRNLEGTTTPRGVLTSSEGKSRSARKSFSTSYTIPGNYLAIPFTQIKNLNIVYIMATESMSETGRY